MFSLNGFRCIVVLFSIIGLSYTDDIKMTKPRQKESIKEADVIVKSASNNTGSPLKITIFYESACPDCIAFFKNQVHPNYKSFMSYITLDFVPYGNANQTKDDDGNYKFDCQHGPPECRENKLQACAVDQLSNKKSSDSLDKFIICYMSKEDKGPAARNCAKSYKVDYEKLKACSGSKTGNELLAKMGDRTHNFRPAIRWVPTIVFNDVYNFQDSTNAALNLKQVICEKLMNAPKLCSK